MSKHQVEEGRKRKWWMPKYVRTPLATLALLFFALAALGYTMQQIPAAIWSSFMGTALFMMAALFWEKEL